MNLLSGIEQDFHRPQKNPGAYEWWHFDGTDEKSGISFSIQFSAGNLHSPFYQDSLKSYWQRTKSPLVPGSSPAVPPNPLDHCGVAFRVFQRGKLLGESYQEFPASFLKASDKQAAVLLGANRFNWDERGDPPSYVVTVQAPQDNGKKLLRARLFFTPQGGPLPPIPAPAIHSTHTWVLAAPLCHVEGTLEWCDEKGEPVREQAFLGKGFHDHHFGSVPLDRFVKAWHWGRVFLGEETLVYSLQVPTDGAGPEGFLATLDKTGSKIWTVAFDLSRSRRNFFWLPYQRTLSFSDAHQLRIDHGRILSDGPASLIFEDTWTWTRDGKSVQGQGLSNYLYTPRLSSSFFFPMLKGRSTLVRSNEEPPTKPSTPSGDVSLTRPNL